MDMPDELDSAIALPRYRSCQRIECGCAYCLTRALDAVPEFADVQIEEAQLAPSPSE